MKIDLEITRILLKRIPEEIIREHILPYTYRKQKTSLLMDIRSFATDWNTLSNYYIKRGYYGFSGALFHDIVVFCEVLIKRTEYSCYSEQIIHQKREIDYFLEYRRLLIICSIRKDGVSYQMLIYKLMFAFINSMHLHRKNIWFLFGLLRPLQRTNFIRKHVLS